MKIFEAQILTPAGPVFKGNVEAIVLPGTEGNFQVLHNHASLMTGLDIGVISVKDGSSNTVDFAVSGGFAEVHQNKVTVLAEAAERKDQIDLQRAIESKRRAEERARSEKVDSVRNEVSLRRALNRIKLVQG